MAKKRVNLGSSVLLECNGINYRFQIVESSLSDPGNGKISGESPIGRALIGHSKKEKVKVSLINGETVSYKICSIYQ